MFWLILLLIFILISPQSNAKREKHSLYYKYTGLTKAGSFSEFIAEAECDDKQIAHYSNEKHAWERDNLTVGDWNKAPPEPPQTSENFLNDLYNLSKCRLSAERSEFHVLQRRIGCEVVKLLDGTVTNLNASDEYAYDGKDFTICKYNHPLPWLDKVKETKMDHQTGQNPFLTNFLTSCMNWILTFNNTYRSPPDIHIFAKTAPDDHSKLVLSCLVTGFYPRDIEMYIRLDRNILEDQRSSGIKPNADGSFQIRSSVKIDRNHKGSYDCFVTHSSLTEPLSLEWDGKCSNCEPDPPRSVTAGVVFLFLLIVIVVCCICICKKRRRSHGL